MGLRDLKPGGDVDSFSCLAGSTWSDDLGRKPDGLEAQDGPVRQVELPPSVAVCGTPLAGVVVVVPALAVGQEGDDPVVPAILAGRVIAVSPEVGRRVHGPGDVPDIDR